MNEDSRKLSELTVGEAKALIKHGIWQAVKWWVLIMFGLPILGFALIGLFGYIMYPK